MTSPARAPRPTPRRIAAPASPRAPHARPHLRVVPPPARPRRRRRRSGAILAVATVLVFGSLLTSAVLHGMLVSGQAHLDQLEADLQETRTALAREKLHLAELQAPSHIAGEAQLIGMVPADGQRWLSPGSDDAPVLTGVVPPVGDPSGEVDGDADLPVSPSGAAELAAPAEGATR